MNTERRNSLVQLANRLGNPSEDLAILAEGNVSGRADETSFWVKASGFSMQTLGPEGLARVNFAPILDALSGPALSDPEVREVLKASRCDPDSTIMPSVETFMHAYLLSLPEVIVVAHTHPTPLISLLSLEGSREIAKQRLFPDEVVCCGPKTAYVGYTDPGLPLAQAIARTVQQFIEAEGEVPKSIWLENHGLITVGKSEQEAESATRMGAKAARAWLAAMATGRPLRPLTPEQIARIHTRPDEHYRQRLLWTLANR